MIISYTNNFAVIRPPKTGSTSLLFYFINSGLVDEEKDIFVVDRDVLITNKDLVKYKNKGKNEPIHQKFSELVKKNIIDETMPCVATIRNPLEWFSSVFYYISWVLPPYFKSPNAFFDGVKNKNILNTPLIYNNQILNTQLLYNHQCDYFPEHAELLNTENLHEHVSKYILKKGGKVVGRIKVRNNPNSNLDAFLAELTPNRKQDILDTYAKDFELWEKAYAVYN